MKSIDLAHPFGPLGLFSDPLPKTSIMQMKLLEEEAMRHFPQMDAKARAVYVSHSIEQANKPQTND
jgi:hypothetical protein